MESCMIKASWRNTQMGQIFKVADIQLDKEVGEGCCTLYHNWQ